MREVCAKQRRAGASLAPAHVGPLAAYGLTLLFPIACVVYDRGSRGRVHLAYWWGLAIITLGVPVRVALLGSQAWRHAMQSLFG